MENILRKDVADAVSSTAIWAILTEAAVTPKPGLVDRANSGAHTDMDFFTLIDSALALIPWFRDCALEGFDSGTQEADGNAPSVLFETLRPRGKIAEALMKKASGGVNTHRGYIFCLGILCAAYGRLHRNKEEPSMEKIIEFAKTMTASLAEDFSRVYVHAKDNLSHGELVFTKNGIQGIRGEVSRGFPSITEHALPLLCRMLNEGYSINDAGIAVLLNLIAHTEDTNIIYRRGIDVFHSIQDELRNFFTTNPDMDAIRKKAANMDKDFISNNISPGGSADLLGTTFFLHRICMAKKNEK